MKRLFAAALLASTVLALAPAHAADTSGKRVAMSKQLRRQHLAAGHAVDVRESR